MGSSAKKSHGARWALPAVLLTAGLLWAGNFTLGITEVDAPSKNLPAGFDGFRIALITDLHGRTFGKNNDALVEKTILWFRENAFVKERLGAAIDRVGVDAFEAAIATDDLLLRKDAILAAPLKERQA